MNSSYDAFGASGSEKPGQSSSKWLLFENANSGEMSIRRPNSDFALRSLDYYSWPSDCYRLDLTIGHRQNGICQIMSELPHN